MAVFRAGIVLLLHDVSFQVHIATADQLVFSVFPWVNFVLPWVNFVLPWVNFVLPWISGVLPLVKFVVPWIFVLPSADVGHRNIRTGISKIFTQVLNVFMNRSFIQITQSETGTCYVTKCLGLRSLGCGSLWDDCSPRPVGNHKLSTCRSSLMFPVIFERVKWVGVYLYPCALPVQGSRPWLHGKYHQRPTFLQRSDSGDTFHFRVQNPTCFKREENDFNINFWNLNKVLEI